MLIWLLICCSSLLNVILTQMICSKNLTRLEPKVRGSRADLRLPFYPSGFV